VLLILDDLTTHAKVYREISLIGKKFPGRGSYPGDMFFTHSRLLERAGNFVTDKGPVSITCLPVAETVESDISGYIQTNIMSITDGHVFFDQEVFDLGRRPAINYFLSVTRVGRQTQSKLRWSINRELLSFLTLLDKTQEFVHFGAEINEGIKATLTMGSKVLNFFNQPMGLTMALNLQIVLFSLIWSGLLSIDDSTDSSVTVEKATNTYANNTNFRDKVDELVQTSDDFNVLLKNIALCSKDLIDAITLAKVQ
jgi:F-type H+-transporting ATPase subunit alpha